MPKETTITMQVYFEESGWCDIEITKPKGVSEKDFDTFGCILNESFASKMNLKV